MGAMTEGSGESGPRDLLDGNERELLRPSLEEFRSEGPSFDAFTEIYTPQEIGADVQAVETKRAKIEHSGAEEKDRELYAMALEMVLMEFGNGWLPGSFTRASVFDDYQRGTDLILEIQDDAGTVHRIGLDAASGRRAAEDKVLRITDNLSRGKLNELKYFESDLEDIRGAMEMPQLIMGTDTLKDIAQLARLYMSHEAAVQAGNSVRRDAIRESIDGHALGQEIVRQLDFQLRWYPGFLRIAAKKMPTQAAAIEKRIAQIEALRLLIEPFVKEETPAQQAGRGKQNGVTLALRRYLEPAT
jgi:hypothetical protein